MNELLLAVKAMLQAGHVIDIGIQGVSLKRFTVSLANIDRVKEALRNSLTGEFAPNPQEGDHGPDGRGE